MILKGYKKKTTNYTSPETDHTLERQQHTIVEWEDADKKIKGGLRLLK